MIKLGVFFQPEDDLINDIESLKMFFMGKSDKNKYLDHIVHSTIYVLEVDVYKLNDLISEFESLRSILYPISSKINKWRIFEDDILTGLNTLCLEIKLTKDLKLLQNTVVRALCKFHSKKMENNFKGEQKHSNNKYGYPFVGNHWIPHITVGSLNINPQKILDYSDGLFSFSRNIKINNLCLYRIEKDSHELIKKIEF